MWDNETIMPFGIHKGTRLGDLPVEYMRAYYEKGINNHRHHTAFVVYLTRRKDDMYPPIEINRDKQKDLLKKLVEYANDFLTAQAIYFETAKIKEWTPSRTEAYEKSKKTEGYLDSLIQETGAFIDKSKFPINSTLKDIYGECKSLREMQKQYFTMAKKQAHKTPEGKRLYVQCKGKEKLLREKIQAINNLLKLQNL